MHRIGTYWDNRRECESRMALWFTLARRQPIACNIWNTARRTSLYVAYLNRLPIPALEQLDGGLHCPFLLDFGLTAEQRVALWQAVWDRRTLVRTATAHTVHDEELLHSL